MTPTTTQIAESQQKAEDYLREKYGAYRGHFAWREIEEAFTTARTEQAAEIAELKAKLAEVMPLAKFAAKVLITYKNGYVSDEEIGNFALSTGCVISKPNEVFAPNIEATIEQLLKD